MSPLNQPSQPGFSPAPRPEGIAPVSPEQAPPAGANSETAPLSEQSFAPAASPEVVAPVSPELVPAPPEAAQVPKAENIPVAEQPAVVTEKPAELDSIASTAAVMMESDNPIGVVEKADQILKDGRKFGGDPAAMTDELIAMRSSDDDKLAEGKAA